MNVSCGDDSLIRYFFVVVVVDVFSLSLSLAAEFFSFFFTFFDEIEPAVHRGTTTISSPFTFALHVNTSCKSVAAARGEASVFEIEEENGIANT